MPLLQLQLAWRFTLKNRPFAELASTSLPRPTSDGSYWQVPDSVLTGPSCPSKKISRETGSFESASTENTFLRPALCPTNNLIHARLAQKAVFGALFAASLGERCGCNISRSLNPAQQCDQRSPCRSRSASAVNTQVCRASLGFLC